jgi:hypothetical protein
MGDQLDDENDDGLGCFKFQLFLDDIEGGPSKKKQACLSASQHKVRQAGITYTAEPKRRNFEYSPAPTPESRMNVESNFRRVFDMINEQEPESITSSALDKKNKKGTKNLTPETNYTQKDSRLEDEDGKSLSCKEHKREFNMWGSYKYSREEDNISKKTLTAFSEAFEPDNLSMCQERKETTGSVFDLDGLKLIRAPKKHSMAGMETSFDFFNALRPNQRKLSFQQDRKLETARDSPSKFNTEQKKPVVSRRFSTYVQPKFDDLLGLIGRRVDKLLTKSQNDDFPSLAQAIPN